MSNNGGKMLFENKKKKMWTFIFAFMITYFNRYKELGKFYYGFDFKRVMVKYYLRLKIPT